MLSDAIGALASRSSLGKTGRVEIQLATITIF